jgi:SWI/SNF-related matrix-associated actin-dependent regulator of chromatin subfamily A-like protein 1
MSAAPTLRDYQRKGIAWLRERLSQHKAVLLCDDMGLGKTVQALGAAGGMQAERILIVCPAGARRVWHAEIQRWFPHWMPRVFLAEPGTPANEIQRRITQLGPVVLIVGYDELSNLNSPVPGWLKRRAWDLLILDEAHYLKNLANRTRALYGDAGDNAGIQSACSKVILLTGTPTPNHAGELYQHARTFWPRAIFSPKRGRPLSLTEFEDRFTRYKDTVFGRQVAGSKNQAQLREALSPMVLRRRKAEVLPELPPLILQDIPLTEHLAQVRRLSAHANALAQRLGWAAAKATDDQLIKALHVPDPVLTTLRRELGELKVLPTIAWVQERMNSTNKILLFAWHHSVIEHLRRGLQEFTPVVVTGATSPSGRDNAIKAFQHRSSVRLFIGQLLATGTAITLTAANEVAIVEPSWVPGENVQAICRAHRIGQYDSVLASFLYLPGTLDAQIMSTFRRKAAEIAELQGDFNASSNQYSGRSTHRHGHDRAAGDDLVSGAARAAGRGDSYQRACPGA